MYHMVTTAICFIGAKHVLSVYLINRLMHFYMYSWRYNPFSCIFHRPVAGFSLLIRGFLIKHNDALQSVGLLWTSDQSVAETST